jgi:hypothetical protein
VAVLAALLAVEEAQEAELVQRAARRPEAQRLLQLAWDCQLSSDSGCVEQHPRAQEAHSGSSVQLPFLRARILPVAVAA